MHSYAYDKSKTSSQGTRLVERLELDQLTCTVTDESTIRRSNFATTSLI